MPTYQLGNIVFPTKSAALKYTQLFLRNYDSHQNKQEVLNANREWICDLLSRHPRFAEKIGTVDDILDVQVVKSLGNNCFCIIKTDGTHETISYKKCFVASSSTQSIHEALRWCIHDQIKAYRDKIFSENEQIICCVSGRILRDDKYSQVDHDYNLLTFQQIISDWCCAEKIDLSTLKVTKRQSIWELSDKNLLTSFQDYHKSVAKLRVIHCDANVRNGKS